jgi:hypothetical protein
MTNEYLANHLGMPQKPQSPVGGDEVSKNPSPGLYVTP